MIEQHSYSELHPELQDFDFKSLGLVDIKQARKQAVHEITEASIGNRVVFPTGFKKLDKLMLGGFTPGTLTVIGGEVCRLV